MKNSKVKVTKKLKNKTKIKLIKSNTDLGWFKLDNAALIYPAVSTGKWNAVYRVSAVLKETVDAEILNKALATVVKRFPHFNVCLKSGFFWFYFQGLNVVPKVMKDENYPCQHMDFKHNKHLFRVLYFNKKVSLEIFHSLTDGNGAILFLNTLLTKYFDLLGNKIDKRACEISYLDKPTREEAEDSFERYADLKSRNSWSENKAYQIFGTKESSGKLNIINGIMSSDKIKEISKKYNATVTEFLLAVLFRSVLNYQQVVGSNKKPVRISVPINLRKIFKSKTLRNFSSYRNIEFDANANELELSELISGIKERTRTIDKEYVMGNINANVKAQKNIFLRITPLFIKNLVLKAVFFSVGERLFTMTLSNLGKITAPKEFNELVDHYEMNLGAGKINSMASSIATFNNKLVFTFSSSIKETNIEKEFFRCLSDMGIKIKIESNRK